MMLRPIYISSFIFRVAFWFLPTKVEIKCQHKYWSLSAMLEFGGPGLGEKNAQWEVFQGGMVVVGCCH